MRRSFNAKMKAFLTILIIIVAVGAYGQRFRSRNGTLIFEQVDSLVSDTYFVPPSVGGFEQLFSKKDTIKALRVAFYSGGCLGENRWLRDTMLRAKALAPYQVEVKQTNHRDLEYSDQYRIYTASGTIKYLPSQGCILGKQYKTIFFQGKKVVVEITYYQPFNELTTARLRHVFN